MGGGLEKRVGQPLTHRSIHEDPGCLVVCLELLAVEDGDEPRRLEIRYPARLLPQSPVVGRIVASPHRHEAHSGKPSGQIEEPFHAFAPVPAPDEEGEGTRRLPGRSSRHADGAREELRLHAVEPTDPLPQEGRRAEHPLGAPYRFLHEGARLVEPRRRGLKAASEPRVAPLHEVLGQPPWISTGHEVRDTGHGPLRKPCGESGLLGVVEVGADRAEHFARGERLEAAGREDGDAIHLLPLPLAGAPRNHGNDFDPAAGEAAAQRPGGGAKTPDLAEGGDLVRHQADLHGSGPRTNASS